MKVAECKTLKKNMEERIRQEITLFTEATGLVINLVDVLRYENSPYFDEPVCYEVDVEVTLP